MVEDSTVTKIVVEVGNYDVYNLVMRIQILLNQYTTKGYIYSVKYLHDLDHQDGDADINKLQYSTSNTAHTFQIYTDNSIMSSLMGLKKNVISSSILNILVSPTVINLKPIQILYIKSDICQGCDQQVLELIPVGQLPYNSFINFQLQNIETCSKRFNFNLGSSNVFRFYITNHKDESVDFQGQEINFSLIFYRHN